MIQNNDTKKLMLFTIVESNILTNNNIIQMLKKMKC